MRLVFWQSVEGGLEIVKSRELDPQVRKVDIDDRASDPGLARLDANRIVSGGV